MSCRDVLQILEEFAFCSSEALFCSNCAVRIAQPTGHEKAPDLSPDPGLPYFIKPAVRQHDRAELWAKWRDSQQINQDFAR